MDRVNRRSRADTGQIDLREVFDPGGLDDLDPTECWRLLATQPVGRLAVVVGHYPLVFPVNYVFDADAIVFRTAPGTKLSGAAMGRVAFEVDSVDETTQTGWSVIVEGVGNEITSALDHHSEQLRQLEVEPWVPGQRARWLEILHERITGRRLGAREKP